MGSFENFTGNSVFLSACSLSIYMIMRRDRKHHLPSKLDSLDRIEWVSSIVGATKNGVRGT